MRFLLDASALLPLVTKHGRNLIAKAHKDWFAITDLAIYEACNSVWKMTRLLQTISVEDGMETVGVIRELIQREILHLLSVSELELGSTLKLAMERRLTYYDASYVMTAKHQSAVLITQDRELAEAAREQVEVIGVNGLEKRLSSGTE